MSHDLLNKMVSIGVAAAFWTATAEPALADKVRAPKALTGLGYTLEIDDEGVALVPGVELEGFPKNRSLSLRGAGGQLLDVRRLPITEEALKKLTPRELRFGFALGSARSLTGVWDELLMPHNLGAVALEARYQPELWGVLLSALTSENDAKTGGIKAERLAKSVKVGAFYTLVPFAGRLHTDVGGGLVRTAHALSYYDQVTNAHFKIASYGAYGSAEARYGILGNVWFSLGYELWLEHVAVEALGVKGWDAQQRIMGGIHRGF